MDVTVNLWTRLMLSGMDTNATRGGRLCTVCVTVMLWIIVMLSTVNEIIMDTLK